MCIRSFPSPTRPWTPSDSAKLTKRLFLGFWRHCCTWETSLSRCATRKGSVPISSRAVPSIATEQGVRRIASSVLPSAKCEGRRYYTRPPPVYLRGDLEETILCCAPRAPCLVIVINEESTNRARYIARMSPTEAQLADNHSQMAATVWGTPSHRVQIPELGKRRAGAAQHQPKSNPNLHSSSPVVKVGQLWSERTYS